MVATEIKIHLRNLIAQGLIQGDVDVESGENVYSLTNKGKNVTKKL
jgi:DNA-binding PadR family transcriptional regulator